MKWGWTPTYQPPLDERRHETKLSHNRVRSVNKCRGASGSCVVNISKEQESAVKIAWLGCVAAQKHWDVTISKHPDASNPRPGWRFNFMSVLLVPQASGRTRMA